jgi:hypothetical protein
MDYAAEAEKHRRMAEEFRRIADTTPHEILRPRYLDIADVYDKLADNEVRVAHNLKIAIRPPQGRGLFSTS